MGEHDYTHEQKQALWDIINIRKACPNCAAMHSMTRGPMGGVAMNISCSVCHMIYNITPFRIVGAYPIRIEGAPQALPPPDKSIQEVKP